MKHDQSLNGNAYFKSNERGEVIVALDRADNNGQPDGYLDDLFLLQSRDKDLNLEENFSNDFRVEHSGNQIFFYAENLKMGFEFRLSETDKIAPFPRMDLQFKSFNATSDDDRNVYRGRIRR